MITAEDMGERLPRHTLDDEIINGWCLNCGRSISGSRYMQLTYCCNARLTLNEPEQENEA